MDDFRKLQIQADNQRIEIIELRNEQRMTGFARIYAAATVAGLVLMWFPVYEPVKIDSGYGEPITVTIGPLISAVRQGGLIGLVTIVALGGLIGLTLAGTFRTRIKTPAIPIAITAISALGVLMLLIRFGGAGEAELSPTGSALLTLLFLLAITAVVQIVAYFNQPVAINTEPVNSGPHVPPSW